jgi:hypothetical protein
MPIRHVAWVLLSVMAAAPAIAAEPASHAPGHWGFMGSLIAQWSQGSSTAPNQVLAIVQHFDYMNNNAYEFGGQSVGPLLTALDRFAWINVTNGSVYNEGSVGSDADHCIHGPGLRLVVPVKGALGSVR